MKNTAVAAKINKETMKMHNVQVTCNYQDNLALFGKIENVQAVVRELCAAGLTVFQNEIPTRDSPYYDGNMVAIVGRK